MTQKNNFPGVIFAFRFPDNVGVVWQSLYRTYCYTAENFPGSKCFAAFPKLTQNSLYHHNKIKNIELDMYSPDTDRAILRNILISNNIKVILFVGASPAESQLYFLRSLGIFCINYEQESYDYNKKQDSLKRLGKIFLRRILKLNIFDLYLANSHAQENFLKRFTALPSDRVITLVNGVDLDYFNPQNFSANLRPDTNCKYILSISQLRPEKQVDLIIKAAGLIKARLPQQSFKFIHLGDGPERVKLDSLIKTLGLEEHFNFAGHQDDVRPYLQMSDIFVHAAERESFGYAIAEAMACGLPVVALNAAGPSEIIENSVTGFLCSSSKIEDFAERIIALIDSPQKCKTLGKSGRLRVIEHFSAKQQGNDLALIINRISNNPEKFWPKTETNFLTRIKKLPFLWKFSKLNNFFLKVAKYFSSDLSQSLIEITKNKKLTFLQIGSNDGKQNDPLYQIAKLNNWSGLLIEPQPELYQKLCLNYPEDRFKCLNCAISQSAGVLRLFRINPLKVNELPSNLRWFANQIASFNYAHVAKHIPEDFHNLIEEIKVESIGLMDCINNNNLTSLDLIHTDTEGYDYKIINQIDFNLLSPQIIICEHQHLSSIENFKLLLILEMSNYKIHDFGQDYLGIKYAH